MGVEGRPDVVMVRGEGGHLGTPCAGVGLEARECDGEPLAGLAERLLGVHVGGLRQPHRRHQQRDRVVCLDGCTSSIGWCRARSVEASALGAGKQRLYSLE